MAFVLGEEFMHVDPRRGMSVPSCSARYFCLGALLIFVGSVLLCALGFTIVLPHEATRDWPLTDCEVINSTYDNDHCSCDKHPAEWDQCVLKYPCLQVRVLYAIPKNFNTANVTMVDERGYGMLYRYWSDAFYQTCALYECGDEEWNVREVKRFRNKFGTDRQQYQCYLDPDDPLSLILERTPTSSMIHAILWPSLSLFIGLIIWLGLCCGCWKIEIEDKNANRTPGRYGLL